MQAVAWARCGSQLSLCKYGSCVEISQGGHIDGQSCPAVRNMMTKDKQAFAKDFKVGLIAI